MGYLPRSFVAIILLVVSTLQPMPSLSGTTLVTQNEILYFKHVLFLSRISKLSQLSLVLPCVQLLNDFAY